MRNKKVMSRSKMILVFLLALTYVLVGCTDESNTTTSPVQMENQTSSSVQDAGQKIKIVTTIFPPYDFVKAIGGDKVEVVMLLSPGMESHTYEPTPADIKLISSADLFIHAGSENDTWVESVVPENVKRLEMMSHVNVLMETHDHHHHDHDHDHGHNHGHDHGDGHNHGDHDHESTSSTSQGEGSTGGEGEGEGHEEGNNHGDHNHGHNHGHGHDHDHAHHEHPDEHVWTSPINAMRIVNAIAEELSHLDPANKDYYTANADAYKKELENLDKEYRMLLNSSKRKMIVFADRFPFRYLANEYQMEYVAAFSGCSTETEVSASVVAMLVEEVKEHEIPVVFKMEFSNDGIARAVSEASGAKILELHSAHNLTAEEIQSGETYLTLMRKNLEALKEALN